MPSSSVRRRRGIAAVSGVCSLFMWGAASVPARADTPREQQWFLDAMKADEIWRISTGAGITVAVIDTGVDPSIPDLTGQVLPGRDFSEGQTGDAHVDYDGHGTSMAALIAGKDADGRKGPSGLAPGAKILPIRMPKGGEAANQAEGNQRFNKAAPQAIRYAADQNAKVINISMGRNEGSPQLTAAVQYAIGKGSLIFAAVGNSGNVNNEVEYPGATPGVVGVSAVSRDQRKTPESEYGPQVDMAAPGDDIVHACPGGTGLCRSHGTSDATALASASAALIWSKHPEWTNNQVLRVMLNTIGGPTDGAKRNDSIGYGIVRPRVALVNPGDPGPADVYPLPDPPASAASPAPAPAKGAAPRAEKAAGNRPSFLLPLGIAAGVGVVGALVGVWAWRRRNRQRAVIAPAPAGSWGPGPGPGWPERQHPDRTGRY
ncbi:type VII secretion-associated serine protease mycosin [Streptomyces sp. NPDC006711]|uniref:type VII secretion-associated serine protease mycosin n=1 Tax=Streptomyces sp. NPDC006711 TaxID=3364762 RepID=UPI003684A857